MSQSAHCDAGFNFDRAPGPELSLDLLRTYPGTYELVEATYFNSMHLHDGSVTGDDAHNFSLHLTPNADGARPSVTMNSVCQEHSGEKLRTTLNGSILSSLIITPTGRFVVNQKIQADVVIRDSEIDAKSAMLIDSPTDAGSQFNDYIPAVIHTNTENGESHIYRLMDTNDIEIRTRYVRTINDNGITFQTRTVLRRVNATPIASPAQPAVNAPATAAPSANAQPTATAGSSICTIRGTDVFINNVSVGHYASVDTAISAYRNLAAQEFCRRPTGICKIRGLEILINDESAINYSNLDVAISAFNNLSQQPFCTQSTGICSIRGLEIFIGGGSVVQNQSLDSAIASFNHIIASGVCTE